MSANALVVKANKLIEARYKLNLNEQKIILYAVSKLDQQKSKFNILEIQVREFTKLIGTTSERYSEIKQIISDLMKKQVIISTDEKELVANWVSSVEYIKESGKIELEFSEKLIPYLLQLSKHFTRYQLKNILDLKNKYSIRIYELLKQYEKPGHRSFELEELKKIIGCEDKYKEFKDFKRYVLEVSKQELKEHTDISFSYKKVKEGRRVTGIKFIINSKVAKTEALLDMLYTPKEIKEIKIKAGLGDENFSSKQIMELYEIAVKKTDSDDINLFEYIRLNYLNMIRKGTVRNKFSWLKKALENDYASAVSQIAIDVYIAES